MLSNYSCLLTQRLYYISELAGSVTRFNQLSGFDVSTATYFGLSHKRIRIFFSNSPMYFLTIFFHGEELLVPRPTPKLEDHPLSTVRDCLFNLFAATVHIGGCSSIRNPRTRHAVVTGTHKHGSLH